MAIWLKNMSSASVQSVGAARKVADLNIWKGFALMANKSSIVETFMAWTRNRRHRYWENATASEALKAMPKALARMLEAVDIYDWGAICNGPSAFLPSRKRNRMRCTSASTRAELASGWVIICSG